MVVLQAPLGRGATAAESGQRRRESVGGLGRARWRRHMRGRTTIGRRLQTHNFASKELLIIIFIEVIEQTQETRLEQELLTLIQIYLSIMKVYGGITLITLHLV